MSNADDFPHPIGEDAAWSESYYFNFVDPDSKIAMFTRMGFRAKDGWADGLHVVYLGGDRVAFTYGRKAYGGGDHDLTVGDLSLHRDDPMKKWRICYDGPAQDIADAAVLITPSKERDDGWFTPQTLTMEVCFDTLIAPHYATKGEHGHFEQTGKVSGTIKIGDERFEVNGYGVRDKSWGPRSWSSSDSNDGSGNSMPSSNAGAPDPFVNWFSMTFGDQAALGCSCFAKNGEMRGEGWVVIDGKAMDLNNIRIESTYQDNSILHKSLRLTGTAEDGTEIDVTGNVLTICPTKIPSPGGATFVNEGLASFKLSLPDRSPIEGDGIAEYWHALKR